MNMFYSRLHLALFCRPQSTLASCLCFHFHGPHPDQIRLKVAGCVASCTSASTCTCMSELGIRKGGSKRETWERGCV